MLLAIDAGNTNIVFAIFDDTGSLTDRWRYPTKPTPNENELAAWLDGQGVRADAITGAIIATVVPAVLEPLRALCSVHYGCPPLVVEEEGVELGAPVRVERPQEVGADRLVNTVAAAQRHGCPLIVVDFGTATTFDVIDVDGAYAGGVIAPGVNLAMEALHNAAALLPRVSIEPPERVVGGATVPAMQSGLYWGYVGLVEGLIARIRAERGEAMAVVATGGLAPLFAEGTDSIDKTDADLTLHGLYLIHQRNTA